MSYLRPPNRMHRDGMGELPKIKALSGMSGLGGACCASCAQGGACAGGCGGSCGGSCGGGCRGMGDVPGLTSAAPAAPADLNTMVADIRSRADQYVEQDRYFRMMQIGATLAIPLAAAVWKFILGRRQSSTLVG